MSDDTISRAAALDGLSKLRMIDTYKIDGDPCLKVKAIDVYEMLKQLPSAQPEIIYCRECKWKQGAECVRFAEVRPFPDDFCSRAKRRTDEQTD
jgi:hypothetical protein